MTREEAFHVIDTYCVPSAYPHTERWEILQKIKEAIEVLKQEFCEDAISRQAAIDAVKKNTFRLTFAEEQGCEGHVAWSAEAVYSDVIEGALLELPPVNPQPKTGHCEECKHFRKFPHHAGTLGRCIQHTRLCTKSDWYCADYEPQERGE